MLTGTSLEAALNAKLNSLEREFTFLREKTSSVDWCQIWWWHTDSGTLTFNDWKYVDAIYRSRALDLPGTGSAIVPCVDMANHASGDSTSALYETDSNGNAVLILREGQDLAPGDEVTITYGDDKGACEMLFSYGFIESTMRSAQELFLDLEIPDDDPLKLAKKAIARSAPGFRLFLHGDSTDWESTFVWLLCVNEEDGLEFKVLQNNYGERQLESCWKGAEITDLSHLVELLKLEPLWDVFELRAITTLQSRVEQQLLRLEDSKMTAYELSFSVGTDDDISQKAMHLRDLEEILLLHAYGDLEAKVVILGAVRGRSAHSLTLDRQKSQLLGSAVVEQYLGSATAEDARVSEDDFS